MGREVRMVPENWVHPLNERGQLEPLHDMSFTEMHKEWTEEKEHWDNGEQKDWLNDGYKPKNPDNEGMSFEEWSGSEPQEKDYMPEWEESEKTHLMMYETCTEGTPISPAFKTPEEIAKWLYDNEASAFGSTTASYEGWLATCRSGFAVTGVMDSTGFHSGVDFNAKK